MRRYVNFLVLVLLLSLIVCGCSDQSAAFVDLGYEEALQRANEEKKVVMLQFSASWCGPCRQMDQETFSKSDVQQYLQKHTIPIKVDVDNNRELAQQFGIMSVPTTVFVSADGKIMDGFVGFQPAEKFLRVSKSIIEGK